MMKRTIVTIEFDEKYHAQLFEDWMSNLGEQEYWQQLDVEKENRTLFGDGCPTKLLDKHPRFDYPKRGKIVVTSEDEE